MPANAELRSGAEAEGMCVVVSTKTMQVCACAGYARDRVEKLLQRHICIAAIPAHHQQQTMTTTITHTSHTRHINIKQPFTAHTRHINIKQQLHTRHIHVARAGLHRRRRSNGCKCAVHHGHEQGLRSIRSACNAAQHRDDISVRAG